MLVTWTHSKSCFGGLTEQSGYLVILGHCKFANNVYRSGINWHFLSPKRCFCIVSTFLMVIPPNEVKILPDKSTLDDPHNSGHVVEYTFTRSFLMKWELHKTHASWQEQEQPRTRLQTWKSFHILHTRSSLGWQLARWNNKRVKFLIAKIAFLKGWAIFQPIPTKGVFRCFSVPSTYPGQ